MVHPLKDELLSSWLYRLAEINATKLHTFSKRYFPKHPVWNRDIDKSASPELLKELARITTIPSRDVFATVLPSYEGQLLEHINSNGNSKWVLPLGIYHRLRKRFGLQFCPRCLIKDGLRPYFRKYWRLSIFVSCPICGLRLHDRCPFCFNPVAFHRNEQGTKNFRISSPICCCSFCKNDFRDANEIASEKEIINMQRTISRWINQGFTSKLPYSHLYFDVLYQIIKLILTKHHSAFELQKLLCLNTTKKWKENKDRADFEHLSVTDREGVLHMAFWLLAKWPNRMISICKNSRTTSSTLLRDFPSSPYWYHKVVMDNFYFPNPIK